MSVLGIAGTLARAAIEGALFVAAVWAVCRLFPRLPAALRCALWWAACLKLLLGLVPLPAVRLAVLPAAAPSAQPSFVQSVAPARTLTPGPSPFPVPPPSQGEGNKRSLQETATVALIGLWIVGLLVLAVRALRELRSTRRIVRLAEPIREGWVRTAFAGICARLGLRRAPELRGSAEVRTPQVTGLAQPVVLIPRAGLDRLTPAEVSMMLCHELVHLRRKDLWLGWVPALAHRLFFFHPLAALAAREYAIAREAACDAEVLRILGSAPQDYGRLLLRWGVAPRETGLAAAGASPSLQTLKRRLKMLQSSENKSGGKRRVSAWWWLAGVAVLAGLIPLRIVAQEGASKAPAATPVAEIAEAPEAEAPAEPTPAPEAIVAEAPDDTESVGEGVSTGEGDAVAPVAPRALPPLGPARALRAPLAVVAPTPMPPLPPMPSLPALAPRAVQLATPTPGAAPRPAARMAWTSTATPAPRAEGAAQYAPPPPPPVPPVPPTPPTPPRHHGYYSYRSGGDGDDYVFLYGGSDSVTMSGSTDDIQRVKRLRSDPKSDLLWFRHGGKEYVVRDAALLQKVKDLSKAQGELGARQGALGERQGKLGAQQGELGSRQGAIGAEQGSLAAERGRRGDDADTRSLDKREKELEAKMEDLGRQQEALGKQQEELGQQQEKLGEQQEELGRKAEKEMHDLIDRAIKSGAAQEVK
ncbi:MAG TPA: M56 family metallopeptidase [Thermoanaerobaculia bacterium]|nr:M56 family metallopeptidase [Thermoanaerobaculia bacterium]